LLIVTAGVNEAASGATDRSDPSVLGGAGVA
jgi:hypothetical protein